jgi:hypothetical protein
VPAKGFLRAGQLISVTASAWGELSDSARMDIARSVNDGATLYFAEDLLEGRVTLRPFAETELQCKGELSELCGYSLSDDRLLPHALRGENVRGISERAPVCVLSNNLRAHLLVSGLASDGSSLPLLFAIPYGAGAVICDLAPEDRGDVEMPILKRLSDPALRVHEIGALIAAERASGSVAEEPGYYNLTLDDRPVNFDYFSVGQLGRWIDHMRDIAPDAHLDCGWTPNQNRPTESLVAQLKAFGAGFVWHGLLRHVDYSQVAEPAADLAKGMELVRGISARYAVDIQPVMIFPYECRKPEAIRCLKDSGFVAIAENAEAHGDDENYLPPYMRYSTPFRRPAEDFLPVMRRFAFWQLNRDRMLALAALGLPLIAVAHPRHVGLKRSPFSWGKGDVSCFDAVLRFAREKHLRPTSLEQLAAELNRRPQPLGWHEQNRQFPSRSRPGDADDGATLHTTPTNYLEQSHEEMKIENN